MSNSEPKDFQIPDVLNERYVNYERLASGGMGVVYKAWDNHLDKAVAIKTVLIDQMTPEMILRFQQEARAASRLNHPNLITTLDFGMTEKNKPYLVMEFVDGHSLESRLNSPEPLPIDEAVWILAQICEGMSHAHKTGVIHRDLKPSNIMLLSNCRPEEPNVRIVDFGIAKIKDLFNTDERVTKTGAMLGSPYYVSPEQINGAEVDPRADVYSFGCIMYRMFSGAPPFEGETYLETITAHLKKEPQPFSEEIDVPEKLKSLIFRCLSKSPDGRPETMDALADELHTISGADEIIASGRFPILNLETKKQTDDKTSGGSSSKRKLVLATAGVLALLITVGSIAASKFDTPGRSRSVTNKRKPISEPNAYEAVAPTKFEVKREGNNIDIEASTLSSDSDLQSLKNLKFTSLTLKDTAANDQTIKKIRELDFKLLGLDLAQTKITDACVNDLNGLTTLHDLMVPNTAITDKMLQQLKLPLTFLDIDGCKIGDAGIKALSNNCPTLMRLEVSQTQVTVNGLKYLRNLPRLRTLYLSNQKIDDQVIDVLKTLHLSSLFLTEARISKETLKRLSEIKTLTKIEVSHVQAADKAMCEWLTTSMPGCKIVSQQNQAGAQLGDMSDLMDALGK